MFGLSCKLKPVLLCSLLFMKCSEHMFCFLYIYIHCDIVVVVIITDRTTHPKDLLFTSSLDATHDVCSCNQCMYRTPTTHHLLTDIPHYQSIQHLLKYLRTHYRYLPHFVLQKFLMLWLYFPN